MSLINYFVAAFTEEDFMRLWKGLFYSMWMSDKPLIQVCFNCYIWFIFITLSCL